MLDQKKGRGHIDADGLLPFFARDLSEWFYHCYARIIHEQINRLVTDFSDQIGDTANSREIVNLFRGFRTTLVCYPTCFCQRNGVASMQQEHHIRRRQL